MFGNTVIPDASGMVCPRYLRVELKNRVKEVLCDGSYVPLPPSDESLAAVENYCDLRAAKETEDRRADRAREIDEDRRALRAKIEAE